MLHRYRQIAWVVSGALLIGTAIVAVACSTDNGSGSTPLPTPDGAKPNTGIDSSSPTTDGGTNPDAAEAGDPDCGKAPSLRSPMDGGEFYCPFKGPDGKNAGPCAATATCCNGGKVSDGGFGYSFCADGKNGEATCKQYATDKKIDWAPEGGTTWACADKSQCGADEICCLFGAAGGKAVDVGLTNNTDVPKACKAQEIYNEIGTKCVKGTKCGAGEVPTCTKGDTTCGAGTTCTAALATGRDLGVCK